jgi:alpha/beta superfamily hydrolase
MVIDEMAGEIKSFFIAGPIGQLEALLNTGDDNAKYAALVCHPHPRFGGTMHNKVVYAATKALNGFGFPVLRFNFRGAGLSEGEHAGGQGERDDVRAALDWLHREFHLPLIFAGFSFGAAVGLRVACPDERVRALISLGTPVNAEGRSYQYEFLRECTKPKLFASGGRDQYGPRAELERVVAAAAEPKKLVLVGNADHFFALHLHELRDVITTWIESLSL